LCPNLDGHNELFHRKQFYVESLFTENANPVEPNLKDLLGPLAQRRSSNQEEWIFNVNDNIREMFIDQVIDIDVARNVFIISTPKDVTAYEGQFRQDFTNQSFCAVDIQRLGFWNLVLSEWELSCGEQRNGVINVTFANGRVYVYDLTRLGYIPRQLKELLKSTLCIKVGFAIFEGIQFLNKVFNIEAWHIVDARYIFLVKTALNYTIKKTSLKDAAKYILGKDIDTFDKKKWCSFVHGILFTCAALIYPKRNVTILLMEKFICEILWDFVDCQFDYDQLFMIINDKEFSDIDFSMSTDVLAELRRNYRTNFYPNKRYPHSLYRLFEN